MAGAARKPPARQIRYGKTKPIWTRRKKRLPAAGKKGSEGKGGRGHPACFLRAGCGILTSDLLFSLFHDQTEMVDAVAKQAGLTKKAAAAAFAAIGELITGELKKGHPVVITGFGTFKVSKRAARTGVNPRNPSEKIKIPAMKVGAFKAGKALKEAVR